MFWQMRPSYSVASPPRTLRQSGRRTSVSCHISVTSSLASEVRPSCWTLEPAGCRSGQATLSDKTTTYIKWLWQVYRDVDVMQHWTASYLSRIDKTTYHTKNKLAFETNIIKSLNPSDFALSKIDGIHWIHIQILLHSHSSLWISCRFNLPLSWLRMVGFGSVTVQGLVLIYSAK